MATSAKRASKSARQARRDRIAAAQRTATKLDTGADAATHDEHPEDASDSTVAHAKDARSTTGEGGFPQGEYDVTEPELGEENTKGVIESILEQHIGDTDVEAIIQRTKDNARLAPDDFDRVVEVLPVGTIIEHEADNRWRVHVRGQNRYGHGTTHSEAVEAFVLGTESGTEVDAAAQRFNALSPRQQQEIRDRDAKAARTVGGSAADDFAREEARKIATADKNAALPAANAATDGPEKASARAKAGQSKTASKTSTRKGKGKK